VPAPAPVLAPAPDDELADLRRLKEVLKLKKEIADIEAVQEKLPARVAVLEAEVVTLRKLIRDAVDSAVITLLDYTTRLAGKELTPEQKAWLRRGGGYVQRTGRCCKTAWAWYYGAKQ